jgi:hypothetical protein
MTTAARRFHLSRLTMAAGTASLLAACGGGGQQPPAPVTQADPTPVILSGVAATGAPLAGATVKVTDRRGDTACSTTAEEDGRYSCTLPPTAQAPLAVSATLEDTRLFSVVASAASGTVNVTPLTTLIVARLAPDGDPARLAAAIAADPELVTEAKVEARVAEVRTMLAPLLSAVGDQVDPLRGRFATDGTGHDKVLDSLQVSIRPEASSSNIEITVKARPASDDAGPLRLAFRSSDPPPPALAAPLHADDLVDDGVAGLVHGLMGRLTACYAEPLRVRIDGVADGAAQATGGAAQVKAPACRGLFLDDDPATYKDNGYLVGHAGAYSGLFRAAATGAKFDRANFEHQLANGDLFITFRTTSATGAVTHQTLTVRQQGGQLKAVGNQYAYDASVRAYVSEREFPLQPQFSWVGSGYAPAIRNHTDPVTKLPLFSEARVTAPDGRVSTYRPLAGRSSLGIVDPASGRQRVNVVQFVGAAYQQPGTAGHPADKDGNSGAFFLPTQLTDDQIRALPDQGVWSIEFVHADPSVPNVVQTYRTVSRAPTLGEIRQMRFPQLSYDFKAELLARADGASNGGLRFGAPSAEQPNAFRFGTASGGDGWTVPDGAWAPSSVTVYGASAAGATFNDSLTVATTDRKGTVGCSTQSAGDLHCDASTGVVQLADGARINAFDLWTRSARQVELQKQVNLYRLTP